MEYEYDFEQVQQLIDEGKNEEAENMLMGLQTHPDKARWNYLMAVVSMNKGWLEYGHDYAEKAVQIEPQNQQYSELYEKIKAARNNKNKKAAPGQALGCCTDILDCCSCCSSLSKCVS